MKNIITIIAITFFGLSTAALADPVMDDIMAGEYDAGVAEGYSHEEGGTSHEETPVVPDSMPHSNSDGSFFNGEVINSRDR